MVFAYLFWMIPCVAIQTNLYYAKIMRDSYRMKFNKFIMNVKDVPYKRKAQAAKKKKPPKKPKTIGLDEINKEELDKQSANSEERKEAELAKAQEFDEEEEFEQDLKLEVEGGHIDHRGDVIDLEGGDKTPPKTPPGDLFAKFGTFLKNKNNENAQKPAENAS